MFVSSLSALALEMSDTDELTTFAARSVFGALPFVLLASNLAFEEQLQCSSGRASYLRGVFTRAMPPIQAGTGSMIRPIALKQAEETAAPDTVVGTLPGGTEVVAVSIGSGRALLTTVDDYVTQQSPFDRQARVNLRREVVEVTLPIYFDYVASQVMAWSQAELTALKTIGGDVSKLFASLSLRLPAKIQLVKTSGQEEGYAAYTRRRDTIVLPANMIASVETAANYGDPLHPADDLSYLQNVFIHECFHLFSKNHPQERRELYERIGYRSTGSVVDLPDVSWGPPGSNAKMRDLKITNPDEPAFDIYVEMLVPSIPGQPGSPPVRRALAPLLLANGPYQGGVFFEYLEWWFMAISQETDQRWVPMLGSDGRPLMYESAPLMQQYLAIVSANFTAEIFEPDEILAQNFVLAANQPSLDLLVFMRGVLSTRPSTK
jgi:hypothetical protein